jgi:hypothetical protein
MIKCIIALSAITVQENTENYVLENQNGKNQDTRKNLTAIFVVSKAEVPVRYWCITLMEI